MEGFNPDVVVIDKLARQFAVANQDSVKTDYIIQAMLNDKQNLGGQILRQLHISPSNFTTVANRDTPKITFVEHCDRAVATQTEVVSTGVKSAYINAKVIAYQQKSEQVGTHHILLAILQDKQCSGAIKLQQLGINSQIVEPIMASIQNMHILQDNNINFLYEASKNSQNSKGVASILTDCAEWGYDLTAYCINNNVLISGREQETQKLLHILNRKSKNNAILIGEAGVGKTAIVEGIAEILFNKTGRHIFSLDIAGLMGGAKYRGDCEKRCKKLFQEINASGAVLFIDEIHTIMSAGDKEGGMTVANLIKPMLARGGLSVIGATTLDEHKRYLERDTALMRRFQSIQVKEPSVTDCIKMITASAQSLSKYHNIAIPKSTIKSAVELSSRYIKDRQLPDKALDLLDEAGARLALSGQGKVLKVNNIAEVISENTGIPQCIIASGNSNKFADIEQVLSNQIIGQAEAIKAVARAVRNAYSKLRATDKPISSMLFIGESGVGKTALAQAIAKQVFGQPKSLIRLDMSEFMEKHSVSRIIGAPIGYVGYDDGTTTADIIRRQPHSVLLLDEIEKAHSDVLNIFLQVLDAGKFTDTHSREIDCTNLIVIMTSNIGVTTEKTVGFISNQKTAPQQELKKVMRAELINRIDDIVVFNKLNQNALCQIAQQYMATIKQKLKGQGLEVKYKSEVVTKIVSEIAEQNARTLKRAITQQVEDKITQYIVKYPCKRIIEIIIDNNQILCK